jgi:hypothetical protein
MDTAEWLEVTGREYLEDFVRAGGAAVKLVVPGGAAEREELRAGLATLAAIPTPSGVARSSPPLPGSVAPLPQPGREPQAGSTREPSGCGAPGGGFQLVTVEATTTRMHLIDQLFFAVARQLDWDALAGAFLRRHLIQSGLRVPDEAPDQDGRPQGRPLSLAALQEANDSPGPVFDAEAKRGLINRLYGDGSMSRELRLAMLRLCLAQLDPADDPDLAEAVRQWLRGELRLVSAVKRALIFQRIARHNARHLLVSLTHWLRLCGRSGLVLLLDVTRYGDATPPRARGSGLYYSPSACLDLYEVLRQLIDATDELAACYVVVVAGPEFLTDERRGLRSYQALYLRVADEVRDRYRPNPRSALVRLGPALQPAGVP